MCHPSDAPVHSPEQNVARNNSAVNSLSFLEPGQNLSRNNQNTFESTGSMMLDQLLHGAPALNESFSLTGTDGRTRQSGNDLTRALHDLGQELHNVALEIARLVGRGAPLDSGSKGGTVEAPSAVPAAPVDTTPVQPVETTSSATEPVEATPIATAPEQSSESGGRNVPPNLPGTLLFDDPISKGSIGNLGTHIDGDSAHVPPVQMIDLGDGRSAARFKITRDSNNIGSNYRNQVVDNGGMFNLKNDGRIYDYAFSTRLVDMQPGGLTGLAYFHDVPVDESAWNADLHGKSARMGYGIGLAVEGDKYVFYSGGQDDPDHMPKKIWEMPYKEGEFVDWKIRVRSATEDDSAGKQNQGFVELYMNGKLVASDNGWNQHGHDLVGNRFTGNTYFKAGIYAGWDWGVPDNINQRIVDIGYVKASVE